MRMCCLGSLAALLSISAVMAQPSVLPQTVLDIGTTTARLTVQGQSPNRPFLLVIGTGLLPAPVSFPGVAGALELDLSSAVFVTGVLDGLGRHELNVQIAGLSRGMRFHAQVAVEESANPADLRISTLASDHVPGADGRYLDEFVESGIRSTGSVPEIVALPQGGYRLFFNIFGGIGSASSADGLTFTADPGLRLTHPNTTDRVGNAAPLVLPDGSLRLYYIHVLNAGMPTQSETVRSAVSSDWMNFTLNTGVRYSPAPVDNGRIGVPDLVRFEGGLLRMYYIGDLTGANNVRSAVSTDGGLTFAHEMILTSLGTLPTGQDFVDPDVLRLPDGRLRLLAMAGGASLYAFTSGDGLQWSAENGGQPVITASMFTGSLATTAAFDPACVMLPDGRMRAYVSASNNRILSAVTTPETGRGTACPTSVLCTHDLRVATSNDGLTWTGGPILLSGASVPAPVRMPDGRVLVYFVDGTTLPDHLAVFELVNGVEVRDLRRVTLLGVPAGVTRYADPAPVLIGTQLHLYGTLFGNGPGGFGIGRGVMDATGTVMTFEQVVAAPSLGLVDSDVVPSGTPAWTMFSFGPGGTTRLTSATGLSFSSAGAVTTLLNRGHSRPQQVGALWRMYTFDQFMGANNAVRLYTSPDLITWTDAQGPLFYAPAGRELTDAQVIPDGSGWLMVFKTS